MNKLILKASIASDGVYLTPEGKTVLFRKNRKGQTYPIEVDASDYIQKLADEGYNVQPGNQTQLQQVDAVLRTLQQAGQVGGPQMQAKYEQQFKDSLTQRYTAANDRAYNDYADAQAQKSGKFRQDYDAEMQAKYEQSKDKMISSTDKDGVWSSYIEGFDQELLEYFGEGKEVDISSDAWGTVHAFDAILRRGLDMAKKGQIPSGVSLESLLAEEIKTKEYAKQYFYSHYDPQEGDDKQWAAATSIITGLDTLQSALKQDTELGKYFEESFDMIYSQMFDNYVSDKSRKFLGKKTTGAPVVQGSVPADLPAQLSDQEIYRLSNYYEQAKTKAPAAHKALIHTMIRLYDSIPDNKKPAFLTGLADADRGLHRLHQITFGRVFNDMKDGTLVRPDAAVKSALQSALDASETGDVREAEGAIRDIVTALATVDAAYAFKNNPKGDQSSIRAAWENSPILGGRQASKGEGPNLMSFLKDKDLGEKYLLPNSTLKITGVSPAKTPVQTQPTTPQPEPKFNIGADRELKTKDGYSVKIVSTQGKDNPGQTSFPTVIRVTTPAGSKQQINMTVQRENDPAQQYQAIVKEIDKQLNALRVTAQIPEDNLPTVDPSEKNDARIKSLDMQIDDKDLPLLRDIFSFLDGQKIPLTKVQKSVYRVGGPNSPMFTKTAKNGFAVINGKQVTPVKSLADFQQAVGPTQPPTQPAPVQAPITTLAPTPTTTVTAVKPASFTNLSGKSDGSLEGNISEYLKNKGFYLKSKGRSTYEIFGASGSTGYQVTVMRKDNIVVTKPDGSVAGTPTIADFENHFAITDSGIQAFSKKLNDQGIKTEVSASDNLTLTLPNGRVFYVSKTGDYQSEDQQEKGQGHQSLEKAVKEILDKFSNKQQ